MRVRLSRRLRPNEDYDMATKKLKTVTLDRKIKWALIDGFEDFSLHQTRNDARAFMRLYQSSGPYVLVRLNPITGVVSK